MYGASIIVPLPTKIPTWWIGDPKNTRSPGSSWLMSTWGSESYWAAALCERETPAAAQAYIVRPEQSKTSGPEPAYTYGFPSWALAVSTATWASGLSAGGPAEESLVPLDDPPLDDPVLDESPLDEPGWLRGRLCLLGLLRRGRLLARETLHRGAGRRFLLPRLLGLDLVDERLDVAVDLCEQALLLLARRADLGAGRIELVALLHGRGASVLERGLLHSELLDVQPDLVEQLAVLVGGGAGVLGAGAELARAEETSSAARGAGLPAPM